MDCEGCKFEKYSLNDWPCCYCYRALREDMFEPAEDNENE